MKFFFINTGNKPDNLFVLAPKWRILLNYCHILAAKRTEVTLTGGLKWVELSKIGDMIIFVLKFCDKFLFLLTSTVNYSPLFASNRAFRWKSKSLGDIKTHLKWCSTRKAVRNTGVEVCLLWQVHQNGEAPNLERDITPAIRNAQRSDIKRTDFIKPSVWKKWIKGNTVLQKAVLLYHSLEHFTISLRQFMPQLQTYFVIK